MLGLYSSYKIVQLRHFHIHIFIKLHTNIFMHRVTHLRMIPKQMYYRYLFFKNATLYRYLLGFSEKRIGTVPVQYSTSKATHAHTGTHKIFALCMYELTCFSPRFSTASYSSLQQEGTLLFVVL